MKRDHINNRILGIDPCPRGFGFMVFDIPDFLSDWGVKKVVGKETKDYLVRVMAMVDRYKPDVITLPDPADYKRRPLLRTLAAALIRATTKRPIVVRLVSKDAVRKAFPPAARTKYDRAIVLTTTFPELRERLPAPRKIWESEDTRMNIFDALCLVLATPEGMAKSPLTAHPPVY